ncbi:MAG: YfhO family protein, partial [Planctomycetales bacterium]
MQDSRNHFVAWGCVVLLAAWFFGDALWSSRNFVYRDAAHFYYPLFEFVQQEWAAGRVPLWNPYENCGTPLLANGTSSVLYPGKLILAIPIGFPAAYRLYVIGHVVFAAWSAYFLARRWGSSREAAGFCAISYAFCGNVLFQYCNVVFLCGAAWLPLAIWTGDRALSRRGLGWATALGCVLAMMVFAGDPQTAYLAGLSVAVHAFFLWRSDRRTAADSGDADSREVDSSEANANETDVSARGSSGRFLARMLRSRPALLAVAAISGFALCAVQTLPSAEFAWQSTRSDYDVPRSLYEIPGYASREETLPPRWDTGQPPRWFDGLLGDPPPPAAQRDQRYYFSVGPWRFAEYLWPNVAGRQFPENRRWTSAMPAEGGLWTPSFYMGLLPLTLALAGLRFRHANPRDGRVDARDGRPNARDGCADARDRWASWIALGAAWASMGVFGVGWLMREASWWTLSAAGRDPHAAWEPVVGNEFGGLYWLMTIVLPGFAQFRFPGKLLVFTALALSLLAARSWDRHAASPSPTPRRLLIGILAISVVGLAIAAGVGPFWDDWLSRAPLNPLLGPLDRQGAYQDLLW